MYFLSLLSNTFIYQPLLGLIGLVVVQKKNTGDVFMGTVKTILSLFSGIKSSPSQA